MALGLERELVLIADDDASNRALLGRLIDGAGYRSIAVGEGQDALGAALEDAPDLVLLDIGLPGPGARVAGMRSGTLDDAPGDRPLLLAVEGEPRNAALLRAILGRAGYDLVVAGGVTEARGWLEGGSPAMVILDRHLPDGDGLDLIPEIRQSDRLGAIPIVLVSASVLPRDVQAARDAGCDGLLAKPVRVKPLIDEVRRLLDRASVSRA